MLAGAKCPYYYFVETACFAAKKNGFQFPGFLSNSSSDGAPFFGLYTEGDDMEDYDEAPIVATAASVPVPVATQTIEAVRRLGMKELEDELRKCARSITGEKGELVARLVESVAAVVPILASVNLKHMKVWQGWTWGQIGCY